MNIENKYLVFIGDDFYPYGGWKDLSTICETIEEALEYIQKENPENKWAHIVYNGKIVDQYSGKTIDYKNYRWEVLLPL